MNKITRVLIIGLIAIFGIGVALVLGNDDQGNSNDPNTNDRANACYEDGTMASKCDTEWEWICGWFMIRFDAGIFSRGEIPATCKSLLPPVVEAQNPVVSLTWPPAGCYYSAVYDPLYIIWNGNQVQGPPIDMTWEVPCAGPTTGVGGFFMVSAANPTDAAILCTNNGGNFIDEISSAADTGAWPIYRCQIP